MALRVLILAAGKGTRMNSLKPKVVHSLLNKPMINYVLDSVKGLNPQKTYLVVGYKKELIENAVSKSTNKVEYIYQKKQLGTGHAIKITKSAMANFRGDVLILNGDCPGILPTTLKKLIAKHKKTKSDISLITSNVLNPKGYGRIIRDDQNTIQKIVEEKDATAHERRIDEINSGIYCINSEFLWNFIGKIKSNNNQKEYYLPGIIENAVSKNRKVSVLKISNPEEILGINNRQELSKQETVIRQTIINKLQIKGITVTDPATTYISPDVKIGKDTVINPNTYLYGNTTIGSGCVLGPNVYIENSAIRDNVSIRFSSYLNSCKVDENVTIGPFAHLRPEANIGKDAKIGNFVEIKNSDIGTGSKVPHLSYIGDATLGNGVNIGAGSITCNYDGVHKHRTVIEDNVFIGSDSMLVAPIIIGKGSTTAAGSTITKDVEEYSLAIERNQQKTIKGWNKRKKKS